MAGIISTTANYGGRVDTKVGTVKQFISSPDSISWIFKRILNSLVVITPSIPKIPVLIDADLIVTGSIFNVSDQRLKENIIDIKKDSIDDLLTLNPSTFTFKNDNKKKKHYGFLAQDVEKVFPELVENNNFSGYKTINYQEFIPLILAKMKMMDEEIRELKEEINELKQPSK
jgi:hypothetical protein